ncbi:MAG: hypothetical protein ACRDT0_23565 [Pseudonocardiaceae bacterium]
MISPARVGLATDPPRPVSTAATAARVSITSGFLFVLLLGALSR